MFAVFKQQKKNTGINYEEIDRLLAEFGNAEKDYRSFKDMMRDNYEQLVVQTRSELSSLYEEYFAKRAAVKEEKNMLSNKNKEILDKATKRLSDDHPLRSLYLQQARRIQFFED